MGSPAALGTAAWSRRAGRRSKSPSASMVRSVPNRPPSGPWPKRSCRSCELFKERLIYEQSTARTVGEQQEKRPSGLSRRPLKIEQLQSDRLLPSFAGALRSTASAAAGAAYARANLPPLSGGILVVEFGEIQSDQFSGQRVGSRLRANRAAGSWPGQAPKAPKP